MKVNLDINKIYKEISVLIKAPFIDEKEPI